MPMDGTEDELVPAEKIRQRSLAMKRKASRQDVRSIIRLILESPVGGNADEIMRVDGKRNIAAYTGQTVDVQTFLLMKVTQTALKGDLDSIKFLFDYGGFKPPKESNVQVSPPTIINNIPMTDPKLVDVTPKPKGVPAPVEEAGIVDIEVSDDE